MARLSVQQLSEKLAQLLENTRVHRVILFGSRARGDDDQYSDTDLIVITETNRPFPERFKDFPWILLELPSPTQLLVYTPDEIERLEREGNSFIERVITEGTVVYESANQRSKTVARPGRE